MKIESSLIIEIWDHVRDQIQPGRRLETALSIIRSCEEYGLDERDLQDVVDTDVYLTRAYYDVFEIEEDNNNDDEYSEDE